MFINLNDLFCHGVLFWFPMCSFVQPFCWCGMPPTPNVQMILKPWGSNAAFKWPRSTVELYYGSSVFEFIKLFKRFQCSASLSSRGLLALFWSSPSFSAHLPCMETERSPWLVWCWLWMGLWQRGRWSSGWRRQAPQARQATTPNPPRVNLHKACQMFRCVSMFRVSRLSSDNFMKASLTRLDMWFCSARSDSTNSISLAFHAFFMCCIACDAMMPWCHVFVLTYFLLLAVLLAAACLVVIVAAGLVNRLLLAWLFCDFFSCSSCDAALAMLGWRGSPLALPDTRPGLAAWVGGGVAVATAGAPERDPAAAMLGPQPIPAPFPNWKLRPQKEIAALKKGRASSVQHFIPCRVVKRARIWPSLPGCRAEEVVQ